MKFKPRFNVRCFHETGCTVSEYLTITSDPKALGAFRQQKAHAVRRGIEWNLTLHEWWTIWQKSGHWNERGRLSLQYVMCRFGDCGPYEVGNVYIATVMQNLQDAVANNRMIGRPRRAVTA